MQTLLKIDGKMDNVVGYSLVESSKMLETAYSDRRQCLPRSGFILNLSFGNGKLEEKIVCVFRAIQNFMIIILW